MPNFSFMQAFYKKPDRDVTPISTRKKAGNFSARAKQALRVRQLMFFQTHKRRG
jgi:hypothetical protein